MNKKGIQVGIDDFGTGYCNLVSIMNMPPDVIKIDKSLLWSAMDNKKSAIMMKSIHSAGFGDESGAKRGLNREQEAFVMQCGCNWIQGYLYARPVPNMKPCRS